MALTIGIIFGLLSMFFYGIEKVIIKKPIDKIGPYFSLIYQQIFVSIILLAFACFIGKLSFPGKGILFLILFAAFVGFFGIYYLYKGIGVGKLSIVLPIANSFPILTVLLSYYFYREKLGINQIAAIIIIFIGMLVISFRYSEIRRIKLTKRIFPGVGYAFVTFLCWGLYFFLIKPVVLALNPITATAYLETSILLFGLLFFWGKTKGDWIMFSSKGTLFYCFLAGIGVAFGALFFNLGIKNEPVSIITPIANSSLLVSVLASRIFLKERIELNQKIAIFLILAGIILISI